MIIILNSFQLSILTFKMDIKSSQTDVKFFFSLNREKEQRLKNKKENEQTRRRNVIEMSGQMLISTKTRIQICYS